MTKKQIRKREENRKAVNAKIMERLRILAPESDSDKRIKRYFEKNHIKTIAIYGGGQVGGFFCEICVRNSVNVSYIIDKFVRGEMKGIPVYQFRYHFLPEVDAVIIVPCHEKEFIKFEIKNYFTDECQLIGIDDCLDEMEEMKSES